LAFSPRAAELAERFPAAKVVPDQIYVEDGALWTSAGVIAGIDLALKLIEDDQVLSALARNDRDRRSDRAVHCIGWACRPHLSRNSWTSGG
jgi:hypothetical protein